MELEPASQDVAACAAKALARLAALAEDYDDLDDLREILEAALGAALARSGFPDRSA